MDLVMSGMDGVEATRLITSRQPAARVLVLTSFSPPIGFTRPSKPGVGPICSKTHLAELVEAIRQVDRGEPSMSSEIAHLILSELRQPAPGDKPGPDPLTDREVEVLRLVGQGKTTGRLPAS